MSLLPAPQSTTNSVSGPIKNRLLLRPDIALVADTYAAVIVQERVLVIAAAAGLYRGIIEFEFLLDSPRREYNM